MANLFATPKGRLSVAAIVVVPLLYSVAYLGAFWNPYGHLNRIPVAVVNEDHGSASRAFVNQLKKDFVVKVDPAARARQALSSGQVGMTLTIGPTFSQAVTHHRPAPLSFVSDPGTNYLTSILMQREAAATAADLSHTLRAHTLTAVRSGVARLSSASAAEARGAAQLYQVASALSHQGMTLAAAGRQATLGSTQLTNGLATWQANASRLGRSLQSGIGSATTASQSLASGATTLGSDSRSLSTALTTLASRDATLYGGLAQANYAASQSRQSAAALASLAQQNVTLTKQLQQLEQEDAASPSPQTQSAISAVIAQQDQLAQALASGTSTLASGSTSLQNAIQGMAQDQAQITQGTHRAATQGQSLSSAAAGWSQSAGQWARGTESLNQGSQDLRVLAASAEHLGQGAGSLRDGMAQMDAALNRYQAGVSQTANGLHRLGQAAHLTASATPQLSAPLKNAESPLKTRITTTVNSSYGTGMAPYFLGLSLWVGAVVATVLVPGGRFRKAALGARTRQSLGIATLQIILLGAGTAAILPIHPVHPVLYGVSLVGIGLAWWAIIRFLVEKFGDAGRVVGIALLVIQLAGAGGTYPVLLSPEFFQAIHPFLPMTWAIELLRWTLSNGYPNAALMNALLLAGLGAAALILVRFVPVQWLFDAPTLRDNEEPSDAPAAAAKMA